MNHNDRLQATHILSKITMDEWKYFLASEAGSTIAKRLELARSALREESAVMALTRLTMPGPSAPIRERSVIPNKQVSV